MCSFATLGFRMQLSQIRTATTRGIFRPIAFRVASTWVLVKFCPVPGILWAPPGTQKKKRNWRSMLRGDKECSDLAESVQACCVSAKERGGRGEVI
jgi:hypothetical protein